MKRFAIVLFVISISCPLFSEELILSVDQAVEMALEQNIGLQMNAISLRTKERAKDTVWNNFLPSMNATAGLNRSDRLIGSETTSVEVPYVTPGPPPSIDMFSFDAPIEPTTSMVLGFQASLPINMALGKGIHQTILDYEAEKLSYEKAARELEVNIRKQFWLIKALEAGIELDKRNIETLDKRYRQTEINYQNGLVPELAVLSARVSLENAKPGLSQKIAELDNTIAFFKFLTGIDQDDELKLDGDLTVTVESFDAQDLTSRFLSQRLDVQEINHQAESLKNTLDMTRLYNLTPTLNLGVEWGTKVDDPFESENWDGFLDQYTISATLIFPIDSFVPGSKKNVQQQEIQDGLDNVNLARKQVYENAAIEIRNLVRKLDNSEKTLSAYAYNVELAERSYRLNNEAYDLGTVELLDVEDAQDKLYQAQFAVLFEKFNYLSTLLDLELALNSRLEEMRE